MADEQKKYPYPTKEFLRELTDQIVGWVYNNFSLKSGSEHPDEREGKACENN